MVDNIIATRTRFIQKFTNDRELIWSFEIDYGGTSSIDFNAICLYYDEYIYLRRTTSTSQLHKIHNEDNIEEGLNYEWSKTISGTLTNVNSKGVAYTFGPVSTTAGVTNYSKVDFEGNVLWDKRHEVSASCSSFALNGDIYIGGIVPTYIEPEDPHNLIKIDTEDEIHNLGTIGTRIASIDIDLQGYIYIATKNNSNGRLIKKDKDFDTIWTKDYGHDNNLNISPIMQVVAMHNDQCVALIRGHYDQESTQVSMFALDSDGDIIWSRIPPGNSTMSAANLGIDGYVYYSLNTGQIPPEQPYAIFKIDAEGEDYWEDYPDITNVNTIHVVKIPPGQASAGFWINAPKLTAVQENGNIRLNWEW